MPRFSKSGIAAAALVAILTVLQAGVAGVPEWLRDAAGGTLPTFPPETNAVVLLDEGVTVVKENGDIETTTREAIRILRPEGRGYGVRSVPFDSETRITYLKGWSIGANGQEYEVKEKEAIERAYFDGVSLYSDNRIKTLSVPSVEPGAVVGFEYVHKERPTIYQKVWWLHQGIPVVRSRLTLRLPPGWEFEATWVNYPEQKPIASGSNETTWVIENIPAIESEPMMPALSAIAGRLAITFFSERSMASPKSHTSWQDVGKWYTGLIAGRRQATPDIQKMTRELTANADGNLQKIAVLTNFVQRNIRYVAIEIGIGGYQPHPAGEIFSNLYGDCKDKVTLLSSMLSEVGMESYYAVVHTRRGSVEPGFPTPLAFNHVILAIRLPEDIDAKNLYAVMEHEKLGRLLFFDPTSAATPLGYLPYYLQGNEALLVNDQSGELVQLPLHAPGSNRLLRQAKVTLAPDGNIEGTVQELRWGTHAARWRGTLADSLPAERAKFLETYLGQFLSGVAFQGVQMEGLEDLAKPVVLHYRFVAHDYAKKAGNLLLVRPRVLGQKSSGILEGKERMYPVEYDSTSSESDLFDITLPPGYEVDELPEPTAADCGFAEYKSTIKLEGNTLKYMRSYSVKDVIVPKDKLADLKTFYRQIASDERNYAVLKQTAP